MANPDSIYILGRDWSVKWVEDLGHNFGECAEEPGTIEIVEGLDSYMDRTTLLHEIMHAILRQQGRYYCKAEEEYVTALACGLVTVLDDNPKLRKYLRAD